MASVESLERRANLKMCVSLITVLPFFSFEWFRKWCEGCLARRGSYCSSTNFSARHESCCSSMHASSKRHNDQVEQLKGQLHDLRKEICQLIKREGAKQEFRVAQILEEVRELNKWIQEAFSKGTPVAGFRKNVLAEAVSESGNQIQNTGKDFKHNPKEIRQNGSRNKVEKCSEVACGPYACNKSSALSLQSPKNGSCPQMWKTIWKQFSTGVVDERKAVYALDTEDRAVKTQRSSSKVHAQAVDQVIVGALNAEGNAYALSCLKCQKERMFHAKESDGSHVCKHMTCNADDEKLFKSDIPYHSNPVANAVETRELDLKGCALRAFSFMENHAGFQATAGKVGAYDMKEIQHKGRLLVSKRRLRHECMMPSKSGTANLVSCELVGKQPWFLPIKERRSFRQPTCHFTCADIERLVTAVEKFGTGRWRDIKEAYFSVGKHRSATNLKDKWRSLLHSAKLAPEKRRSVKLPSMLVKRILDIDEGENLAHLRSEKASCELLFEWSVRKGGQ